MPAVRASKIVSCSNKAKSSISFGDKFGKITIKRRATDSEIMWYKYFRKPVILGALFLCECECGVRKLARSTDIKRGHIKSCGCEQQRYLTTRLSYGKAAFNDFLSKYKKSANLKGLVFELSRNQFKSLITQNCEYCGIPPSKRAPKKCYFGNIVANGIDRVDNKKGYTLENCVPCCKQCNMAKRSLTVEEFKTWAIRLGNNLNKEGV